MDIELRLLRSLVAIYETGSLSKAADRLNCTQAAMSLRLKMIEDEMGERLFLRQHHHLEPTSLGSSLYAKALGVLASYDEMMSSTRSKTRIQRIRIGAPDDYSLGIIAPALSALKARIPGYEFEIVCDLSANLVAALHRQDLDLALASLASAPSQDHVVVSARLHWVASDDFRLQPGEVVPIAAYPEGCVFRRRMIAMMEADGRPWRIMTQSRSHAGILAAVRAGLAVTAMAEGTVPAGLVALNTDDAWPDLGHSPIYLVRGNTIPRSQLAEIETAILTSLESAYGRAQEAPLPLAKFRAK